MSRAPYQITARYGSMKRVSCAWSQRDAIRRCRDMVCRLGADASGEVRCEGRGKVYACAAVLEGGKVVLRVDP